MKRQLLLLFLICSSAAVFGQQETRDILKAKTEKQIRNIIESTSSIVGMMAVDLTNGDSFGVNQNLVFAQASAIKIPILLEVYKQAHEKKFALSDQKPLVASNTVGGSGILNAMVDPVSLSVRNLCVLMIGLSDNSATNTLIELVGLQNVNNTMKELGLNNTRLQRKMIDQAASIRNEENISTPAEAIKVLRLLYEGKFINKTVSDEVLSILMKNPVENSKIAKGVPSGLRFAFKPGGMGGVSTEWTIVYMGKNPYAIAVMENFKTPASNPDTFTSISKVVYEYYSKMARATNYGVILE